MSVVRDLFNFFQDGLTRADVNGTPDYLSPEVGIGSCLKGDN